MRAQGLAATVALLMALAGCIGGEDAPAAATDDVAPATEVAQEPAEPQNLTEEAAPTILTLPVLLDGHTGLQAFACAEAGCVAEAPVPGESDVFFQELHGRVVGGALTLTWEPTSPATETMEYGAMIMGGQGDACPSIELGTARGTGPLTIEVASADRELCADEIVHVWISAGLYADPGPAYAQVDLDQPFHLEGQLLVETA